MSTYRIEETGGDEARFSVDCRLWPIDVTQKVRETRQFSLPLGSSFARTKSMLHSDGDAPLIVGIGISKRASDNGSGFVTRDTEHGCLTFRESAAPGVGSTGIAILVDPVTVEGFAQDAEDYLILVRVTPGRSFTY